MAISDRIQNAKFSKSMAGYSAKEVDAFLDDLLPIVREQEQLLQAMRAKLLTLDKRSEEIAKQEAEAEQKVANAEARAEAIVAAAEKAAEEKLEKAAEGARILEAEAAKNAERILAAADRQGKGTLAEAITAANAERESANAIRAEYTVFESRFRALVADTARALAALQEEAPKAASLKAVPVAEAKPEPKEEPKEAPKEAPREAPSPEETQSISFAGGRPMPNGAAKTPSSRKPYDTLSVTYDDADDFADVQSMMRGKKVKNPTHFSE